MNDEHSLRTPDGRYVVVRGRLWRASDPRLDEEERQSLVSDLMDARRDVGRSKNDTSAMKAARQRVHEAKVLLGERGPVWWTDGKPDLNRRLVKNTEYGEWYRNLPSAPSETVQSSGDPTGKERAR
jgi:hypothetical protein